MATLDNPLRLEIHKRLSEALKEITVANGYVTEVGPNVFRGRNIFGASDPLPLLSILEVPIPLDQREPPPDSPDSSGRWELMVQGWVEDDKENPTDPAHVLMADVKRRLAIERKKASYHGPDSNGIFGLGRNVLRLYIGGGVVRPPDEISVKAYFWLTITLDLVEDLEEPYEVYGP
jgi:hypothetical protein